MAETDWQAQGVAHGGRGESQRFPDVRYAAERDGYSVFRELGSDHLQLAFTPRNYTFSCYRETMQVFYMEIARYAEL